MIHNFNNYLLEKHGLLSGEDSCEFFAENIFHLHESLNKVGESDVIVLIHQNEDCPFHSDNIHTCDYDYSDIDWKLPKWATWELIVHYGDIGQDGVIAGMTCGNMEAHLFIDSNYDEDKETFISTVLHEMKHYYDVLNHYKRHNTQYALLGNMIDDIDKNISSLDVSYEIKELLNDFSYFCYITTNTELSAWLETTRNKDKSMINNLNEFNELIKLIFKWRDDESVSSEIFSKYKVEFNSYDYFKKYIMSIFGKYFEARFMSKDSFEKYMKRYLKITDKYISKHMKVYADGYMKEDL